MTMTARRVAPISRPSPLLHGTVILTMDRKGRVVIPACFRALGEPFILTRATEGALNAFSLGEWRRHLLEHGRDSAFMEFYVSGAAECTLCPISRRVLIPHTLRQYADLTPGSDVALCGVGPALWIGQAALWRERVGAAEACAPVLVAGPGEATPACCACRCG